MTQRQVSENLADEPTSAEVAKALRKLWNGKAAGTSNILPEMLKVGAKNVDFVCMLTDLLSAVWEERRIPHEWVDAILLPIPKKGNLHCCNNWRGIALLDVVGKVAARIVQTMQQTLAEQVFPETEYGFRRGQGCTDMLIVVRQLTQKAFEHHMKQHFIFVDLSKAYDSVPHVAM